MRRWSVRVCLTAVLILGTGALHGQDAGGAGPTGGEVIPAHEETQLERDVRRISSQLRCVVCQGLSLQDSPSELAQEMRAIVRDQLEEGRTEAEVKDYFVSKYGEWVLMEPKPEGFNLAVYILPVLMLVGGAVFVLLKARQWAGAGGAPVVEERLEERAGEHHTV